MQTFKQYSFSEPLMKALERLGYLKPTPVQQAVLENFEDGADLVVQAQTGSGKTLAFALPICEHVQWESHDPEALILTPTRELALQIREVFFKVGRFKRIKAVGVYGKAPFATQQKELKQKTHVVVATPGRLLEHLERGTINVESIRYLVVDEADELLKMGFLEDVHRILEQLPSKRQNLMFSATFPKAIEKLSTQVMHQPKVLQMTPEKVTNSHVMVMRYTVQNVEEKEAALRDLTQVMNPECCMIFCNRRATVEQLYQMMVERGYSCGRLHGDMEQRERFKVMEDFKKGYYRYLISTDVAARGIDVQHVTYVVSYDVPEDKEQYVHRVGRTGRGGKKGQAALLMIPEEARYLEAIEAYIEEQIPEGILPNETEVLAHQAAFEEKMKQPIRLPSAQEAAIHQDIMKLHINAGKKTKMRPVDIVGTLCNLPGMQADDIGIIQVQDISTYVEILNGKGEKVYKQLQSTPIKGRMRRVSKVEHR